MQVWKHWRDGRPLDLLDPSIGDSYVRDEVIRSIQIGLLCAQEEVDRRPNMATVVLMLSSLSATIPTPNPPAFFIQSRRDNRANEVLESDESSSSKAAPASVNEASVTEVYPR